MASLELRDIVGARLESISFFAVVLLLMALLFKMAWNSLRNGFPNLPRLGFPVALGFTLVSALFIGVVLTMISGARELMTPGAWNRVGVMYQLRDPKQDPAPWVESARIRALERLRTELWRYSQAHDGYFPVSRFDSGIPDAVWQGIAPDGSFLAYWGGLKADRGNSIVAYEGENYGPERFVLRANGEISKMNAGRLFREFEEQLDTIYTSK